MRRGRDAATGSFDAMSNRPAMRTYRSSHRRRPSRRSTIDNFQSIRLEVGGIFPTPAWPRKL
jgi:hypothetical protein